MTTPIDSTAASPVRLPGFEYRRVDVEGVTISCAVKGAGPPLLLLHGWPQNHLMWRDVAPALAEDHTVVLADLRGYGDSGKPVPDAAGLAYSKRSMADDQVALMRELGFGLYQQAFAKAADVRVTFGDVIAYHGQGDAVFAGRETGSYATPDGAPTPLEIRTTRYFRYADGRWRQYHHHGSIDDPDALRAYQQAIRG